MDKACEQTRARKKWLFFWIPEKKLFFLENSKLTLAHVQDAWSILKVIVRMIFSVRGLPNQAKMAITPHVNLTTPALLFPRG